MEVRSPELSQKQTRHRQAEGRGRVASIRGPRPDATGRQRRAGASHPARRLPSVGERRTPPPAPPPRAGPPGSRPPCPYPPRQISGEMLCTIARTGKRNSETRHGKRRCKPSWKRNAAASSWHHLLGPRHAGPWYGWERVERGRRDGEPAPPPAGRPRCVSASIKPQPGRQNRWRVAALSLSLCGWDGCVAWLLGLSFLSFPLF